MAKCVFISQDSKRLHSAVVSPRPRTSHGEKRGLFLNSKLFITLEFDDIFKDGDGSEVVKGVNMIKL